MNRSLLMILLGLLLGVAYIFLKGLVIMALVTIIVWFILRKYLPNPDANFLVKVFIAGMALRVLVFGIFYIVSIFQGGNGELSPDSRLYTLKTLDMIRLWTGENLFPGYLIEEAHGKQGFLYVLSFFYMLIGYNPPVPNPISLFSDKMINFLIGTILGVPIFYIAKDIFNTKIAKISSLFAVFFPTLIFWSMTNCRDSVNILLVAIIILLIMRVAKKSRIYYFVLLIISLLFLATIRLYIFAPTLAITVVSLFIVKWWPYIKGRYFMLFITVILAVSFLGQSYIKKTSVNKFLDFNYVAGELYRINQGVVSQQGDAYTIYDNDFLRDGKASKLKFINTFLKGSIYFLFTPFPWAIKSSNQVVFYPLMIAWYLIFPFVLLGTLIAIRYRFKVSFSIICYIFLVTIIYALIEGNVGSAVHHRDLILPFCFIFSAAGLVHVFKKESLFE